MLSLLIVLAFSTVPLVAPFHSNLKDGNFKDLTEDFKTDFR